MFFTVCYLLHVLLVYTRDIVYSYTWVLPFCAVSITVSELYRHQQSLRKVDSEELEALADKMRGKEDHINIVKNQMNALKKAKKKGAKGTRPVNLSTSESESVNKRRC